jgi:peptide-methionine (S)-S-oxide reductase
MNKKLELATFGGGCFWCIEALFQQIKGVEKVTSGYSGGSTENPDYNDLHYGKTGHAEVIQLEFDPAIISYNELLEIFWKIHNPTTLNQQGNDVGEEYRSIILYHSPEQQKSAEESKKQLDESKYYDKPAVTEISAFKAFYTAEEYHQNFYNKNKDKPYCQIVIDPKVSKFRKEFAAKLKG